MNDVDLKATPGQGTLLFVRQAQCVLGVTGSSLAGFIKFFLRRNLQAKAAFRAECADGQCTLLATSSFLEQGCMNIMMIWASRFWPEMNCQQWPSFQNSLIPNLNSAECFLSTWRSTVSEDLKCYTVYLKMIFFFLTESWVSHQSLSYSVLVFLYCNLALNFCLTTYDSFSNIFEMQPLLPHLSSCHPSIPSGSPPPLAPPLHFSSTGEQNQTVITVCRYLLTPTS